MTRQGLVTLVQRKTAQIGNSKTITGSFASTPTPGNMLLAIAGNSGSQASVTPPAGWTVAALDQNGNPGEVVVYKIAGASESMSVTFNGYAAADNLALQLFEFSGVDPNLAPVTFTASGSVSAGGVFKFPSVTTTYDGALIFASATAQNMPSPPSFSGWTSSFTEQNDFAQGKGSFTSAFLVAGAAGTYTTSAILSGDATLRAHLISFQRRPKVIFDLAVAADLRQNLLSFVAPPAPVSNVLILVKTNDCAFSADPVGTETKGATVGNAVVLMNDSLTANLAATNLTVGGVNTTVAFDYAKVKVTHASLTPHVLYCYKLYARAGTTLDGNDSPGRPVQSGTPNAGGSTEPVFVNSFSSLGLSAPSLWPGASAFYVNGVGKVVTVSSTDGARIFAPYTLSNGVQSRSPVLPLTGDTDNTLFTNSLNGDTFAIWASGAKAGTLRWSTVAADYDSASSGDQALGDALYGSPMISTVLSRVFVGTRNLSGSQNRLFALNATTGACVWAFNGTCGGTTGTSNLGQISSSPILDTAHSRMLFTSTKLLAGSTLWALDPKDTPTNSRLLWSRDIGDSDSSLTFTDTTLASIYVGTNAGRIYKLDPSTGSTCWGSTSDGCGTATGTEQFFCTSSAVNARSTSCTGGSPILKGLGVVFQSSSPSFRNIIFSTADGFVHNVNSSGVQRWKTLISGATAPLASPFVNASSGGAVYVGSNIGLVYELSLSTGAVTGTRSVGGGSVIVGDPSLDGIQNQVYVTTSQGKFYAFKAPF